MMDNPHSTRRLFPEYVAPYTAKASIAARPKNNNASVCNIRQEKTENAIKNVRSMRICATGVGMTYKTIQQIVLGALLVISVAFPAFAGSTYSSASAEASAVITPVGVATRVTQILIYGTNTTSTAGFLAILDANTLPTNGAAIVPKECIALPANSTASIRYDVGPYVLFQNGVVVALTSASGCFTFTSGTISGFIKGYAQ